eukprot:2425025-Pyramimonas_sp.AAC.1
MGWPERGPVWMLRGIVWTARGPVSTLRGHAHLVALPLPLILGGVDDHQAGPLPPPPHNPQHSPGCVLVTHPQLLRRGVGGRSEGVQRGAGGEVLVKCRRP